MTPVKKGIAYRLSIILLTVISLLAGFVIATNYYFGKQLSQFDLEMEHHLAAAKEVNQLQQQFQSVAFALRGYLAFERPVFLEETFQKKQEFTKNYTRVKQLLMNDKAYEERAVLERIAENWKKYEDSISEGIRLKKAKDTAGLEQFSKDFSTPVVNQLINDFSTLSMIKEREIKNVMSIKATYSNYLMLWPISLVLGFAVTFFYIIFYLRKSFIHPLIQLEQTVMKIGQGQYVDVPISGLKDELGNLQVGIRDMVKKIQEREKELEQKHLETINQRDLLEAQNEEIIAQQDEQQVTLTKLTEREYELEQITSYQEKLTGYLDYQTYLEHSITALLHALQLDAAMIVMRTGKNEFRTDYSCGYPVNQYPSKVDELYGIAQRVVTERQPFVQSRALTGSEQGLHQGYETAVDYYFPLYDGKQEVMGFLLLTSYNTTHILSDRKTKVTTGLIKQFSMALIAQIVNQDRHRQRDLIQSILESTHEGMVMVDRKSQIVFANQRMESFFPIVQKVDHHFLAFLDQLGNSKLKQQAESFISGHLDELHERFSYQHADQEIRHYEMYANSLTRTNVEMAEACLFVFRDRTEEEKADELKNEFISIVSHELRTPLATVLGFMEILLNRKVSEEKQKKYMETIYKEANRLSQLINDFLDLQRMESGREVYHFEPVEVTAMIREVADQWQDKQPHQINLSLPDKPLFTFASSDRIKQVLHNLISNAIKYSPQADRVDIRVKPLRGKLIIEFQDYGLGIPEDAREMLFTKFYRVDNSDRRQIGGTGLGLAIVKEILEAHKGTITFDSEVGAGTVFTVKLDLYEAVDVSNKILVLEDDENLSKMIGVAFEKFDIPVTHLQTAEEAIFLLNSKQGEAPLLCIVDIQLKGEKSGWEFIRELHNHSIYNQTPVIVSTVLEPPKNYYQKDTEKFLKKPFTIERLLELSMELLENKEKGSFYVFPYQDPESVEASLMEKGIQIHDVKINQDFIQVDVKKNDKAKKADD